MSAINMGAIVPPYYIKFISLSSAVLWKDKSLSLRESVLKKCKSMGVKHMEFIDVKKKERWHFSITDVIKFGKVQTVGQEQQLYFPINMAFKSKYDPKAFKNELLGFCKQEYLDIDSILRGGVSR